MPLTLTSLSEADTIGIGEALGRCLVAGDVVAIDGELGTGKTRLVRGIAMSLGGNPAAVTSPTFTLIHEYATDPPLAHCDAYRLIDSDEFLSLGVSELWIDGVVVVEWASRVGDALPRRTIKLNGAVETSERRVFTLSIPDSFGEDRKRTFHAELADWSDASH